MLFINFDVAHSLQRRIKCSFSSECHLGSISTEVLEQQQSGCKRIPTTNSYSELRRIPTANSYSKFLQRIPTANSDEARVKIGRYAAINTTVSS